MLSVVEAPLSKSLVNIQLTKWPKDFQYQNEKNFFVENLSQILNLNQQLDEAYNSPTPNFIIYQLEHLRSYYYGKDLSDEIFELQCKTWIDDLSIFPAGLVELACERWRLSPNKYAPSTAGELMRIVEDDFSFINTLMYRIDIMLEVIGHVHNVA